MSPFLNILLFGVNNGVKFCQFGDTFGVQALLFGQSMCPHASGVMPIGARGFFTHLSHILHKIVRFVVNNGVKLC